MAQTAGSGQVWSPIRSAAGNHSPWLLAATVSIATFMYALDSSIAIVALNHIAGGIGASYSEATWVITSYLIASSLVVPVSGWLSQVIGRKRYYMICVALFTLSSLACGLAPNLECLVIARILQGLGGGGMLPSERSMLVDSFPPAKLPGAFAIYGIVALLGPAVGPVVGGIVIQNFDWRWIFLISVPAGLLSLVMVWLIVDEPPALREDRKKFFQGGLKIDFLGFALVVIGTGLLQYALADGQLEGWFESDFILGAVVTGIAALIAFTIRELNHTHPILDIGLFHYRNLATATLINTLTGAVLYGTTQLMPELLQQVLGYSALDAGMTMAAGGIAMLFMMPVSSLLTGKVSPRVLVGFAIVAMGLSIWPMTQLNADLTFGDALWIRLFQSLALPFLFIPISSIAFVGVPSGHSGQGSALLEVCRNLGGGSAITLVQVFLYERQQFHQSRIVERLTPFDHQYGAAVRHITGVLVAHGQSHLAASQLATATIFQVAVKQAAIMGFIDVAWILIAIVITAFPAIFLIRTGVIAKSRTANAH